MGHFGEALRNEREARGVTIATIVSATKISSRYLNALEGNQFTTLPGGVINKGIVRSYAREVGLDEEEWVHRFVSEYQQSGQLKDDDAAWMGFAENVGKSRERGPGKQGGRLRWAGVGMLVLLLAVMSWFVWHYVHDRIAAEVPSPPKVVCGAREGSFLVESVTYPALADSSSRG
jgi:cytoskeletal protein RodZ